MLIVILTALYPLLIYLGQGYVEPKYLAIILLLLGALRLSSLTHKYAKWLMVVASLWLAMFAFTLNHAMPLKLYPVLVSLGFLCAFAYTLFFPPSMIERFARWREPHLPDGAIRYTKKVTQIWCAFFIVNASVAAYLACYESEKLWALYTGLISYLLMGVLLVIEFLVRIQVRKHHER